MIALFHGCYVFSDVDDHAVRRAIIFGSVLGSFCVEDIGTRRLTELSREEVHERYQAFKDLTDFAAL